MTEATDRGAALRSATAVEHDRAAESAEDGKRKTSLQVLERTFAILGCFSAERPEWTTTELAEAVELPIATAHRILGVLLDYAYVTRDLQSKRFRLGATIVALGNLARAELDLRRVALPILTQLARTSGETALLTVLDDPPERGLCLERVETSEPLRLSMEPGTSIPLHAGASQKAILANLHEDVRERVLGGHLEKVCRGTVTRPKALRRELEQIRRYGWAISLEENNLHAWGVAVGILNPSGTIVASVGLAAPDARLSPGIAVAHIERVATAAAAVASALGLPAPCVEVGEEALLAAGLERQVLEYLGPRAVV